MTCGSGHRHIFLREKSCRRIFAFSIWFCNVLLINLNFKYIHARKNLECLVFHFFFVDNLLKKKVAYTCRVFVRIALQILFFYSKNYPSSYVIRDFVFDAYLIPSTKFFTSNMKRFQIITKEYLKPLETLKNNI